MLYLIEIRQQYSCVCVWCYVERERVDHDAHNNTAITGHSIGLHTNNTVKPTEISQYLSLHNSIAKLHFPIMASSNEEALHGHVTKMEPNHWTVTVSHGRLLPWNSIMAPFNSNLGGFPLCWI